MLTSVNYNFLPINKHLEYVTNLYITLKQYSKHLFNASGFIIDLDMVHFLFFSEIEWLNYSEYEKYRLNSFVLYDYIHRIFHILPMLLNGSKFLILRSSINVSHLKNSLLFHKPQVLKIDKHKCSSFSFISVYRNFNEMNYCYTPVNNNSNFTDRQFKDN